MSFGLVWPRLRLGSSGARLAFGCLIYSGLAIIGAFLLASIWGAGASTMPLAAGGAQGSAFEETTIMVVAYSSAPTGILAFPLILRGLRLGDSTAG